MNKLIKQAFTLIELLVVIAIIGILSGLIIVGMSGMTNSANIAKTKVFSNSLRNALMMNLVSEYKFEANGNDSWGTNNGTMNGGAAIVSGCVVDSCLSLLGGSTNNVSINDSQSLDTVWSTNHVFTLEAWIYPIFYNSDYQGIINKRTSAHYSASPGGLFINLDGTTLVFVIGTGNEAESSANVPYTITKFSTWIHVVGTSNGSQLKLYINGSSVGNPTPFTQNPPANNEPVTIGAFYAGVRAFNGKIDNVRVYNAAMPASYIKEQYYAGLNSLLFNGQINTEEYSQRINSIAGK